MRFLRKENVLALGRMLSAPLVTFRALRRVTLTTDPCFATQTAWHHGTLPRRALRDAVPGIVDADVQILRAFDREWGTSMTPEELCALTAVARHLDARRVVEIGTSDGGTTLNLAANTRGTVVTVDLPRDFDPSAEGSELAYDVPINMTRRARLGAQFLDHPLQDRIRQVEGDSASLDWRELEPPFDLVFIDGCHERPYVASDTRNALEHLARPGAIVWHDYGARREVSEVVDVVAAERTDLEMFAIAGTRLAVALART